MSEFKFDPFNRGIFCKLLVEQETKHGWNKIGIVYVGAQVFDLDYKTGVRETQIGDVHEMIQQMLDSRKKNIVFTDRNKACISIDRSRGPIKVTPFWPNEEEPHI